MERRNFLTNGLASLATISLGTAILESAKAMAQDDTGWSPIPGTQGAIMVKVLWQKEPAQAALLRFIPNLPTGPHLHPEGEFAYVIQGDITVGGHVMSVGQHSYLPPGSMHPAGKVGPEGLTIFTFTPAPLVFL